ncbi:hypothetical protein AAVH_11162 [Aphelenchoides avenae]|nr:hypothetical protein AAVH_11162 [Aphelenchus avenae]
MSEHFLDSLALCAPSIFLKDFCLGTRNLADGVEHAKVLQALQAFAQLETVKSGKCAGVELQACLIRTCFKTGVTLVTEGLSLYKRFDAAIAENALMEFSFGGCDEQHAERDRFLCRAEVTDCRHKLTLDISISQGLKPQDTRALDGYKQDQQVEGERRFGSVSGRNWTATYRYHPGSGSGSIKFKINQ